MQTGKEVLRGVAEVLDSDPEFMPSDVGPIAQGAAVQHTRFLPTFQGEVREQRAVCGNFRESQWQFARPITPSVAVELLDSCSSGFLQLLFPGLQERLKPLPCSIAWGRKFPNPLD